MCTCHKKKVLFLSGNGKLFWGWYCKCLNKWLTSDTIESVQLKDIKPEVLANIKRG